mmetsp:Transcript_5236/g.10453  ORF Transcript_5236/g.10453 Transcript_5236/m.10453 type:complete len:233 (-) Transcript_5236:1111-1809(-)
MTFLFTSMHTISANLTLATPWYASRTSAISSNPSSLCFCHSISLFLTSPSPSHAIVTAATNLPHLSSFTILTSPFSFVVKKVFSPSTRISISPIASFPIISTLFSTMSLNTAPSFLCFPVASSTALIPPLLTSSTHLLQHSLATSLHFSASRSTHAVMPLTFTKPGSELVSNSWMTSLNPSSCSALAKSGDLASMDSLSSLKCSPHLSLTLATVLGWWRREEERMEERVFVA